jgi:hypothetical protein
MGHGSHGICQTIHYTRVINKPIGVADRVIRSRARGIAGKDWKIWEVSRNFPYDNEVIVEKCPNYGRRVRDVDKGRDGKQRRPIVQNGKAFDTD